MFIINFKISINYFFKLLCRIIGATSIIFSYLGEFMSIINRDTMLSRLEVFWNFGIILLPGIYILNQMQNIFKLIFMLGMAWLVIPQPWYFTITNLSGDQFTYKSWRIFVALCAVPSILSAASLCCLPESPRFLICKGSHTSARKILQKVFSTNTGKEMYEYPVRLNILVN